MNINKLTIGEAREISRMFSAPAKEESTILNSAIGRYVIVRSKNEGINCGKLIAADQSGCVLEDARRIWYHRPLDNKTSWYEGVANTGPHESSKMSCAATKYIIEDYSITVCSGSSEKLLREFKSHGS